MLINLDYININNNKNAQNEIFESLKWLEFKISWDLIDVCYNNRISNNELRNKLIDLKNLGKIWTISINNKYDVLFHEFKKLWFYIQIFDKKSWEPTPYSIANIGECPLTIEEIKKQVIDFLNLKWNIPWTINELKQSIKVSIDEILFENKLLSLEKRLKVPEIIKLWYFLNKETWNISKIELDELFLIRLKLDCEEDKEIIQMIIDKINSQ
jgi:hypothetical protein